MNIQFLRSFIISFSLVFSLPVYAQSIPEFFSAGTIFRVEPSVAYLRTICTRVTDHGAINTSNDTTVVANAMTAAIASITNIFDGYHILCFPAGTYTLNDLTKTGSSCSNIWLLGEDTATIIKRSSSTGSVPATTFTDCNHLRVSNLSYNANNTTAFGGFKIYSSTDVIVEQNHFFDSVNKGGVLYANASDLYGLLFARGNTTSKDIIIRNNLFEDLQTEVAHCQRCLIDQNISIRSPTSVGLGSFAVNGTGSVLEDVTYSRNKIIDAHARGIYVGNDSNGWSNAQFRRIKIIDNEIEYITRMPTSSAIRIGASNTSTTLIGNVFDDVWILNNKIKFLRQGGVTPNDVAVIFVSIGANNAFVVNRLEISKNQIEANGRVDGQLIDVDYIRGSFIEGNHMSGVRIGAIRIQNTGTTTIKGNLCKTSTKSNVVCYTHSGVGAGTPNPSNTIWDDNYFVGINGSSNSALSNAGNGVGDVVEAPTQAQTFGDWLPDNLPNHNPINLVPGAIQTTDLLIEPGAIVVGYPCIVSFTLDLQGTRMWCEAISTTTVRVFHKNETAGDIDILSGTINVQLFVR
jgi:hypothetical protein